MTSLLELPGEIFQNIFIILVTEYGVRNAVRARTACKAFNSETIFAICATKALESLGNPTKRFTDLRLVAEYLRFRTAKDRTHQHPMTAKIFNTIDLLKERASEALPAEPELVREACMTIVLGNRPQQRIDNNPNHDELEIIRSEPESQAYAKDALAFSAHLGLISIVQQFAEEGVDDRHSIFGPVICHLAEHKDPSLLSMYLRAKLDGTLKRNEDGVQELTLVQQPNNRRHPDRRPRDLSVIHYDRQIRHAVTYGSRETVALLVDAFCDDFEDLAQPKQRWWLGTGWASSHRLRLDTLNRILVSAAFCGRLDMAHTALDNGADPNFWTSSYDGLETVLTAAAVNGHSEMFKLLIIKGARVFAKTRRSLLSYAVYGGCREIVQICMDAGMTSFSRAVCEVKVGHEHPLLTAVRHRRSATCHEMLRLLFQHNIVFDPGSELDDAMRNSATSLGDIESLALLEQVRKQQLATQSTAPSSSPLQVRMAKSIAQSPNHEI